MTWGMHAQHASYEFGCTYERVTFERLSALKLDLIILSGVECINLGVPLSDWGIFQILSGVNMSTEIYSSQIEELPQFLSVCLVCQLRCVLL